MRYKFSWIIQTLSWDFPWRKQKKILKMPHSKKIQQFELFLFIPVQIVVAALEESASARTASVQTAQRNNWRERPQKTRPGNYIFFLKKWKNKLKLARAWVLETVKNHHCLEKTKVNIIAFQDQWKCSQMDISFNLSFISLKFRIQKYISEKISFWNKRKNSLKNVPKNICFKTSFTQNILGSKKFWFKTCWSKKYESKKFKLR